MSTTTSIENSGLLAYLLPPFEKKNNIKVDTISVGTGRALKLGENGDVDLVFVHDRKAEDKFMAGGFGQYRHLIMYNDFLLLGPGSDPSGIRKAKDANEAFLKLTTGAAPFISRGDNSGTHKKELRLWKRAGINPSSQGRWYIESGQGMGAVLMIASEKEGYTLTDRGTFLAFADKLDLTILFAGDDILLNHYSAMAVSPEKHPHIKYELARKFIDYLISPQGQSIIASYRINGKQLFHPAAGRVNN